jgi:hypothetical protein
VHLVILVIDGVISVIVVKKAVTEVVTEAIVAIDNIVVKEVKYLLLK